MITAPERVGDLYVQGPSAALMYWGDRQKSRETFQGPWTRTGDKYVIDDDGYYVYTGRSDDMLKVSGHVRLAVRGRGGARRSTRPCSRRRSSASPIATV